MLSEVLVLQKDKTKPGKQESYSCVSPWKQLFEACGTRYVRHYSACFPMVHRQNLRLAK